MSETRLKTVIIDDEQTAIDNLRMLLAAYCPDVEVAGEALSVNAGIHEIRRVRPHLVFLDIMMPFGNGLELASYFPRRDFRLVIVSAHDQYALSAFKAEAMDYLLKPVDGHELANVVERVKQDISRQTAAVLPGRLSLPVADGVVYIDVEHIVHIRANGSYTDFFLTGEEKHLVSGHLKMYEASLEQYPYFMRCHHSHIINLKRVKKLVRNDGHYAIMENNNHVEIARRKKEEFMAAMDRLKN